MAKSLTDLAHLEEILSTHGLSVLGALMLEESHCALDEKHFVEELALLVGNAGHQMWPYFSKSLEYADGDKDPMNRWTRRIISQLLEEQGCEVRYPFDKPYWPFQRIAKQAMRIEGSPLGLLIHPEYGLWHAFRAIIIVSQNNALYGDVERLIHALNNVIHPCDACIEKPCLTACPVSAFDGESLDREKCFEHLNSDNQPDCMAIGCGARNACPVGVDYKYEKAQIEFHMKSYRGA